MAEDDDCFRQKADEEARDWMDAGTVGIRERKNWCMPIEICDELEDARKDPDARCSLGMAPSR